MAAAAFLCPGAAAAQTQSADARSIALGSASNTQNIVASLIESPRPYGRAVIPLGLIQLLGDLDAFDPASDDYDPVLSLDYAANPLHYTFGRGQDSAGRRFFRDLAHGRMNPDLTSYRGFTPASDAAAEGLVFPSIGRTLPLFRGASSHGIYLGVGPYVAGRTTGMLDPALGRLFEDDNMSTPADRTFDLSSSSTSQLALGGTIGYRARLPLPGAATSARSGIYLGGNFHYLHGLWLDDFALNMRLTTDASGLLTDRGATPVTIDRVTSTSGRGLAVDLGAAVVVGPWQFGAGANGIGNRIRWRHLERDALGRASATAGGPYLQLPGDDGGERELRLPVDYIADVGYHAPSWSAIAEYGHGFLGSRFHTGLERRFRWIELRGGLRYNRSAWHPSVGVGFNSGRDVGVDIAFFTVSSSLEQQRQPAVAVSLRFSGRSR